MLDLKNVKEFLSLLKDKTIQAALAALAISIFSFMGGRITASNCDKDTICKDIENDRDTVTEQLADSRTDCRKKKDNALVSLRLELNASCALKISDASEGSDFDPETHCAICVARGECKEND